MKNSIGILIFFFAVLASCNYYSGKNYSDWKVYGGNKENNHYSSLKQVDTDNVTHLKIAWEYHSGDGDSMTQIQVNPVVIHGVLYGVTPRLKLFALDAATGKQKWIFNPAGDSAERKGEGYFIMNVCRGVTYYADGDKDQRIFYGAGSKLFCVDALTGRPVTSFGEQGKIDLHNDLGMDASHLYVASTTPGIIYKDLIIVGTRVAEDMPAAPGHIRAYDVHTGKLRWIFHTIPQPGEAGFETWKDKNAYAHVGGANDWSGFSLDEDKGILFAPTGSAVYDFYGGKRPGDNLYANCLLALDAATGKRIWHFQTVHHDLWDRDLPTAPALVTITKDGRKIEAVAQPGKSGFIFLFDRKTGKPIYPVEEKAVPVNSDLAGEVPSPTQPFPTLPKPFVRQSVTEKDLNRLIPDSSYNDIRERLSSYKTGFIYNLPSKQGTVILPGFDGGSEWGGPAVDPASGILYVNASEMAWVLTLVDLKDKPQTAETNLMAGERLYKTACMSCHGPDRKGAGNYPTLIGVNKKYNEEQFTALLSAGRRMMPALSQLSATEKQALASFVLDLKDKQRTAFVAPPRADDTWLNMPYKATGYNKFLTREGYPAISPPWGTLNAINLNTGELVWKDTLGDYPELKAKGFHTGTENYGGPVVTAGGLIFIAATSDSKIRAFNKRNGKLLWEQDLPACGFATPAVYEAGGKQYVVIACGGGKLKQKSGDSYVAFSL
jgi:quinoprotein glucose dehydrogenase